MIDLFPEQIGIVIAKAGKGHGGPIIMIDDILRKPGEMILVDHFERDIVLQLARLLIVLVPGLRESVLIACNILYHELGEGIDRVSIL